MVGVIMVTMTSFKRTCARTVFYSVPLTPQQATVDPHLLLRLLNIATLTQWMPGVLQSMGSQRVRHNLLNDNIYLLLLVIILCNFF